MAALSERRDSPRPVRFGLDDLDCLADGARRDLDHLALQGSTM